MHLEGRLLRPAALSGLLASAGAVFLADCGAGPLDSNRDWLEVKEQTSCEALAPAYCLGTYGFAVQNSGSFIAGPAPSGASLNGVLADSERAQLSAYAAAVDANLDGAPECHKSRILPGIGDRVDLVSTRRGVVRIFDLGTGSTCYVGGRDRVIRLHDYFRELMSRYYPRPRIDGSRLPAGSDGSSWTRLS